jgi:hypothetical protein
MPGRVTPEEARAHLEAARRDPIMRAIRERDPPPKMTPEQAARLRRIFTAPGAGGPEKRRGEATTLRRIFTAPAGEAPAEEEAGPAIPAGLSEPELAEARRIAERSSRRRPS